ncbi:hypothetical protein G9A89_017663 [Geosiphon pyriformis]|nr:hypothetical protein G9A89_017663 [Geosiphon pyriformis]
MCLIGLWQKALVEFESSEVASSIASKWSVFMGKNSVSLLYTLPVGTTAHNLSNLLNSYDEKTCFIGCNPSLYAHNKCAMVCFENKAYRMAAISSIPVFKNMNLCWTGLSLACCAQCKQFGHISVDCIVGKNCGGCSKQQTPIICPVSFGGKTWAQVANGSSFFVVPSVSSSTSLFSGAMSSSYIFAPLGVSSLYDCLVSLECSLELLANQVSGVMKKLSFVELVPLPSVSQVLPSAVSVFLASGSNSDMILDGVSVSFVFSFSAIDNNVSGFSLSSSKILTTKIDGLESKMVFLEASISLVLKIAMCNVREMNNSAKQNDIIYWHKDKDNLISIFIELKLKKKIHFWIVNKFDGMWVFTFGLESGYLGAGVVIIMDSSLVRHVCKVSEIPGFYAGALSVIWFLQTGEINSLIAKAVNESFFIILGGNFNEDNLQKCASFKKSAGLSGVSNELWKHYNRLVLNMLLVLLNSCLSHELVPNAWKKAWVLMIPKPYK